jgi:hypothetical protein
MIETILKAEAANRQLNYAIRLFFDHEDSVVIHTLAGAASILYSDLIEKADPNKSWDKYAQMANTLDRSQYFNIIREAQNFLKHAKNDTQATLRFNSTDTEHLMMMAVLNCGELQQLSIEQSVFQLWYLGSRHAVLGSEYPYMKESLQLFPNIESINHEEKIKLGKKVLNEHLAL